MGTGKLHSCGASTLMALLGLVVFFAKVHTFTSPGLRMIGKPLQNRVVLPRIELFEAIGFLSRVIMIFTPLLQPPPPPPKKRENCC